MEIKKLADVVEWADNQIEEMRIDLMPSLGEEEFKNLGQVEDFETVKKVVLESIERHNVYTSALNKDLVDKDAKIELLEKEIEGRKEGYYALKEKTDKLKDEVSRLNKCIMNKNESINTANDAIVNLRKEIGAHEEENKKLENRISELKTEVNKLNRFLKMQEDLTRDWKNKYVEAQKEIDEWESDSSEYETIIQYQELIDGLNKDLSYWKEAFETQAVELADKVKENTYLKKELEQTCTTKELDLKGHQRREMSLVNALADKNDEIKDLKGTIEEWKNQERIRTDQLRATERKVEELWKEIERLRDLGEHWKRSFYSIRDSINKRKDGSKEDDDYAREGFKLYVKNTLAEAEGDKNEANEVITETVRSAYAEWGKEQKEKEETEVKGVGRTNSGRYPWGAKVNQHDIDEIDFYVPCGDESIE